MLTADLQPEVARTYGIERSKSRGIATLAVLQKNAAGVARPIKASVDVSAVNAVGRIALVPMREIQENAAIYYIGTFGVADEETLTFKVQIIPDGAKAQNFEFKKTFFPCPSSHLLPFSGWVAWEMARLFLFAVVAPPAHDIMRDSSFRARCPQPQANLAPGAIQPLHADLCLYGFSSGLPLFIRLR
jgi:hypothetical protein